MRDLERLIDPATRGDPQSPWRWTCQSTAKLAAVSLIGTTKTETGLTVAAALDTNTDPVGVEVTDEQDATIHLHRADFHGEWNYTISPR